jgi:hypothetical protein
MTRTALVLAACSILAPGAARPAPAGGSARVAALDALAAKADLPASRPTLPSLLADRNAGRLDADGRGKADPDAAAKGEASGAAKSEAAKENAASANSEAAKAAAQAKKDAKDAVEKVKEEKVRKNPKPPKPPKPPKGGP